MSAALPGAPRSAEAPEFWDALADGRLTVQECVHCGRSRLPRTAACPHCGCWDSRWRAPAGPARLVTCTVVRRAPSAEWAEHAPYGVAVVELEPGCRLLTGTDWLPGADDLGRAVTVSVEQAAGGPRLVAARTDDVDAAGDEPAGDGRPGPGDGFGAGDGQGGAGGEAGDVGGDGNGVTR